MNKKNLLFAIGFGFCVAVAQNEFDGFGQDNTTNPPPPPPVVLPVAPALPAAVQPAPVQAESPAEETLRSLPWAQVYDANPARPHDIVHARQRPSIYGGQELAMFHTSGAERSATVAIAGLAGTMVGDLQVSNHPITGAYYGNSLLTLGYASTSASFGAGLRFGFNRSSFQLTPRADGIFSEEESLHEPGDQFGVLGSAQIGEFGLFGSFDIVTSGAGNLDAVTGGAGGNTSEERNNNDLIIQLGARKDRSQASPYAFQAQAFLHRLIRKTTFSPAQPNEIGYEDGSLAGLEVGFGSVAKQASDFELLCGANLGLYARGFAEGQTPTAGDSSWMALVLSPNVGLAYQFSENLRGLVSGRHSLRFDLENRENQQTAAADSPLASEQSSSTLFQSQPVITLGLGYKFKRVSFEATLSNASLNEGPAVLFSRAGAGSPTLFGVFGIVVDLK